MNLLPATWKDQAPRSKGVATTLTVIGACVALALVPIIYLLLKAVLGIIALAVGVVAGLALWRMLPTINMWLANRALKLMKLEARRNPTETLDNHLIDKAERFKAFREAAARALAAIEQYKRVVANKKRERPDDNYDVVNELVERFTRVGEKLNAKVTSALVAFDLYRDKVEAAKSQYELAQEAAKVSAALGTFDGDAVLNQILEREAFKEIDVRLEEELGSLELTLADEGDTLKEIGVQMPLRLAKVAEPVHVRR